MTVQYEVMTEQYKVMTGSHRSTGFASSRLDLLKDIVCHPRCVAIDEIRFIRLKLHLRGKKLPTPYLRYIHSYVILILWGKVAMISSSLQYTIGIQQLSSAIVCQCPSQFLSSVAIVHLYEAFTEQDQALSGKGESCLGGAPGTLENFILYIEVYLVN